MKKLEVAKKIEAKNAYLHLLHDSELFVTYAVDLWWEKALGVTTRNKLNKLVQPHASNRNVSWLYSSGYCCKKKP